MENEIEIALTARAIAHPARVKIVAHLFVDKCGLRNIDLTKVLGYTKSTVKKHLDMLKDADLVEVNYFTHFYLISLNKKGIQLAETMFKGKE
ncbi:MAG: helix-turn-helix domain-containing protein [Bacteroidota bacterium]